MLGRRSQTPAALLAPLRLRQAFDCALTPKSQDKARKTDTPAPHHKHDRTAAKSHNALSERITADRDMDAIEGTCTHEIH